MNICMLISGSGTTATAIYQASLTGELAGAEPVCVIASSKRTPGLARVKEAGFLKDACYVRSPRDFSSPEEFGQSILELCFRHNVNLIGQYGWLVKTPENVIEYYKDRMVNQHPGPLDPGQPDFGGRGMYGRRVIFARLEFVRRSQGDQWTEATAQQVGPEFDQGEILMRERVEITVDDTVETLAKRLLPAEHRVQIETIRRLVKGAITDLKRDKPLIRPEEIKILEEVKQEAIYAYPNG